MDKELERIIEESERRYRAMKRIKAMQRRSDKELQKMVEEANRNYERKRQLGID